MLKELSVNFGNFLLSFSDAVDLASSQIASHQMRTAFIAWEISKNASLAQERIENLFIASLFRNTIDFKSRFTATHSTGVAECAVILSRLFGLTETEVK